MKTALIAPLGDFNLNVGAIKMAFAGIVSQSDSYRTYLQTDPRYTILHGTPESLDNEDLADMMTAVSPDEVVLPHLAGDRSGTYELAMDFYNDHIVGMEKKPRVMAVAQGGTMDEWMESYTTWLDLELIDVIGVPTDIDFKVGATGPDLDTLGIVERRSYYRRKLVNHLHYHNRLKPAHLLGINNLAELELLRDSGANRHGSLRSVSSVAPFTEAAAGIDWSQFLAVDKHFERLCEYPNPNHEWGDQDKVIAYKNLMTFAEASGDHSVSYNLGRIAQHDEIIQPKENQ